mgnify:FL=1
MSRTEIRQYLLRNRRQRRAALAIGVSPQHLGAWLQGRARAGLSMRKLVKLVDYLRRDGLEVSLEDLVREVAGLDVEAST